MGLIVYLVNDGFWNWGATGTGAVKWRGSVGQRVPPRSLCLWRTKELRAAGDVAGVLRLASRAAIVGLPRLLRQRGGWCAGSVATASAACARLPRHPPFGEVCKSNRPIALVFIVLTAMKFVALLARATGPANPSRIQKEAQRSIRLQANTGPSPYP